MEWKEDRETESGGETMEWILLRERHLRMGMETREGREGRDALRRAMKVEVVLPRSIRIEREFEIRAIVSMFHTPCWRESVLNDETRVARSR